MHLSDTGSVLGPPSKVEGMKASEYVSKCRLLSAYIRVTYTGRVDERKGIIRTVMGYKGFSNNLSSPAISVTDFDQFPVHEIHTTEHPLICRYRHVDSDYD